MESSCGNEIKPINIDTVHKICSGQVVLSLAIAVKELIENSLDAGATNIDIRLKNYGTELIEVSDNGTGVTKDNFAALTLKHHTSKLREYSDLLGVSSFGFRGEALSSLCALSNLTITTRHKSAQYATKIEYDHNGIIIRKSPCSRQVGTTVILTNLFISLPVRLKEFHKNAKREFNKMTQLLYAYCLISSGVKITCSNQTSSNSKNIVVATQGSLSYKDNIACVFGLKQLQSILEIKPEYVQNIKDNIFRGLSGKVVEGEEETIEDIEINLSEDSNDTDIRDTQDSFCTSQASQGYKNVRKPIEFTGYISSCAHGSGRSTTDRQFYYINSRPCEPPKIMKIINETYKQYNPNQYPFVFLNVNIEKMSIDLNITPDKRKIFLTNEKAVLEVLKNSLSKLFESIPRTLKVEPTPNLYTKNGAETNQPRVFHSFLEQFGNKMKKENTVLNVKLLEGKPDLKRKSTNILDFITHKTVKKSEEESEIFPHIDETEKNIKHKTLKKSEDESEIFPHIDETEKNIKHKTLKKSDDETEIFPHIDETEKNCQEKDIAVKNISQNAQEQDTPENNSDNNIYALTSPKKETSKNDNIIYLEYTDNLPDTQIKNIKDVFIQDTHTIYCKPKISKDKHCIKKKEIKIVTDKEDLGKYNRRSVVLKTSMDHIKQLAAVYTRNRSKSLPQKVKFRSTINPVNNKMCEDELTKEISKDSFQEMMIIGQFNLGFIITKLNDDLFIIDQHATDEIYNFEMLQKTTELTTQKLVVEQYTTIKNINISPQPLELTGVNEQILLHNLDVFKKNGFTFKIQEDAPPTKRTSLMTIPMSKNWIFGKEDIEELLFMLRESSSEYCRPSRIRSMFASRACRKSVMIGMALSKADMKKLVAHMAEIDKPWNCPHGRPTIRHLINLAMVHTKISSE